MEKTDKKHPRSIKTTKEISETAESKLKSSKDRCEEAIANLKERIPDINNLFDVHGRIGTGTFSTVFLATMKSDHGVGHEKRKLYAIKHLIPTSHPNRIIKELKCLIDIGGIDNVAGINLCIRRNESVAFIMPYVPHDRFQEFYDKMTLTEIQNYIRNLLIALRRVHKFNIIHRDVKPSNFLYNRKTGQCMLVDFGLAQSVVKLNPETVGKRKATIDLSGQGDTKRAQYVSNTDKNNGVKSELGTGKSSFKMPLKQVNDIIASKSLQKKTNMKLEKEQFNQNNTNYAPSTSQNVESILNNTKNSSSNNSNSNINTNNVNNNPSNINNNVVSNNDNNNANNNNVNNDTNQGKVNNMNASSKCNCYGKGQVCNLCLVKKEIPASRAGTPGYRPPEVLLKFTDQTCAVDMWAVGVIFISILSGVYPFFKAPDDFVALAEIVMLFGDEKIRKTAYVLDRHVTMSRKCKPLNLRKLCVRLKNRSKIDRTSIIEKYQETGKKCEECPNCQQMFFDCLCENTIYKTEPIGVDYYPDSAYALLSKLLEVNPFKRIKADQALEHQFFKEKFD